MKNEKKYGKMNNEKKNEKMKKKNQKIVENMKKYKNRKKNWKKKESYSAAAQRNGRAPHSYPQLRGVTV